MCIGYDVQGGFEGALVLGQQDLERIVRYSLSRNPSKYRPHRPHCPQCADLQGFLAVGTVVGYRPLVDRYRPHTRVSPAYRPPKNLAFCRSFSSPLVIAVGAGDIFRHITGKGGRGPQGIVRVIYFRTDRDGRSESWIGAATSSVLRSSNRWG